MLVGGGALIATSAVLALAAGSARAGILPSPGSVLSGVLGGIGGVIAGGVGQFAVSAFDAIVHALFAPIARFINVQLIGWLVAVPDYAPGGSHVAATERTVLVMAGAALAAVATISIARYWAAGLAGNGASALEGLARTVGAALVLPLWPWVFHAAVGLANDASSGLLGSGSVTKTSANLLAVGVGAGVGLGIGGLGLFVSIVMAVVASVLFLGLLMMKLVLAISTVLIFIGMPIAIVLWPVLPWIARVLARAFAVCLAVPFLWSLCFAAGGALLNDALFLKGAPGFFDALLEPLAAIAMLWLLLSLPGKLASVAMLGASVGGAGFASRAVSYAAGSHVRDATRPYLPGWARGGASAREQPKATTDSRQGSRLQAETVLAATKAAANGGASAGAGGSSSGGASAGGAGASRSMSRSSNGGGGSSRGSASGSADAPSGRGSGWLGRGGGAGSARAYSPPPLAGNQAEVAARGGLQRPSWRQDDFDSEMLEASVREQRQPVSVEQASQRARRSSRQTTRAALGSLVADHGPRVRQHLAYQALGEWTPEQREAIRTLAAASPEVRAQVFADDAESTVAFGDRADPATRRRPTRDAGSAPGPSRRPEPPGPDNGGVDSRAPRDQPRPGDGEAR